MSVNETHIEGPDQVGLYNKAGEPTGGNGQSGWAKKYWLINAIVFQLGWFACILLGTPLALVFTVIVFFLHFRFAPVNRRDWMSVFIAIPMGILHDNLLWYFGVLDFDSVSNWGLAPFWLVLLWSLMALTFNHSLKWFYSRPWILAVMGGIGGPMAYFGGTVLSGAEWGIQPIAGWLTLAAIWVWLLPLHRWLVIQGDRLCRHS